MYLFFIDYPKVVMFYICNNVNTHTHTHTPTHIFSDIYCIYTEKIIKKKIKVSGCKQFIWSTFKKKKKKVSQLNLFI